MNLEQEIMRRLKLEVVALEAAMKQKDRQLLQMEEERKILVSAVLKFGTVISHGKMEMAVPLRDPVPHTLKIVCHPERNERTIQVWRA